MVDYIPALSIISYIFQKILTCWIYFISIIRSVFTVICYIHALVYNWFNKILLNDVNVFLKYMTLISPFSQKFKQL